ncbi:MAG TPA: glutamate cyclase domain-containing protein, partial [Gemmataceae bacterium]|nr:glutamate cyclase domain-containing protein [Gemmataceae bacterium]
VRHSARPVTHLIAIERSGPSYQGRNYTMRGGDITDLTAPAHRLFEGPRDYTTIGIGDGGNEIGMGKVPRELIAKNIPNGELVACRTATDHLIVAGTSNWGGWALAAGVMVVRERLIPGLYFSDLHETTLKSMVHNGPLVDGVTGQPTATVDGLAFQEYAKPLARIAEILRS